MSEQEAPKRSRMKMLKRLLKAWRTRRSLCTVEKCVDPERHYLVHIQSGTGRPFVPMNILTG